MIDKMSVFPVESSTQVSTHRQLKGPYDRKASRMSVRHPQLLIGRY